MNYLKQFIIQFRGLNEGVHQYNYQVDKKFFEHFECTEISNGNIKVDVELNRQERMLIFDFNIDGWVEVACDRCLDGFEQDVAGREKLIVRFGEDWLEESDDVLVIPDGEYEFDISNFLYEYIMLLLPMQCIHPDDENGITTCNPDMVNRLDDHPEDTEPDPRWDALLNLKSDNKQE